MTRLFLQFYIGVLIVLFLAWLIHGSVLKSRADADRARVFVEAHGGGARLIADELRGAEDEQRESRLGEIRGLFNYPVDIESIADLPKDVQRRLSARNDVSYLQKDSNHFVVAALEESSEVVRLGPFPEYDFREIEDSLRGWMRLTAQKLNGTSKDDRAKLLAELQTKFSFPVVLSSRSELPDWPRERMNYGADMTFYPKADDRWFAAAPLANDDQIVEFGPFPSFQQIEQKAATTTLALVLLPAALAIALLLRPVARQLRHVENAAKAIAAGDLSVRVDERRVSSAQPLAQAFNLMASRTEVMVRTQRELLQAVSHELRTPLARIKFAVDLIDTAKDDRERKERLAALDATTDELDELVGELLSYVVMETSEPHLSLEPIQLQESLQVLIPKYRELHPNVSFEVSQAREGDERIVLADRTGFNRAIGNLLSNAGRHAQASVNVATEQNNGQVTVDVDDDGTGIPESDRDRVFEPFVWLNDESDRHGAGLGLALVKRIVTQHGGTIEVQSSPLGGCRIRTTWPVPPDESELA